MFPLAARVWPKQGRRKILDQRVVSFRVFAQVCIAMGETKSNRVHVIQDWNDNGITEGRKEREYTTQRPNIRCLISKC